MSMPVGHTCTQSVAVDAVAEPGARAVGAARRAAARLAARARRR